MAAHKEAYKDLSPEAQQEQLNALVGEHAAYKAKGLVLDMTRGKPSPEQLDLSQPLLDAVSSKTASEIFHAGEVNDVRNYGGLMGLPAARELMASLMDVDAENTLVCGNSSLSIMYDLLSQAMLSGLAGQTPWSKLAEPVKFLCPVPGYDRHFALTEHFGISLIPVPLTTEGPDISLVKHHVNSDVLVKGIWCVPKYANPTGITYSDAVVRSLAALMPAAKDFRIYWDNAYAVHDLTVPGDRVLSIKDACEGAGSRNMWYSFASTSKITFAGAGISAVASSPDNVKDLCDRLVLQTIGPDKINQLRHVLFLRDLEGLRAHMRKHAAIIAPKFEMVLRILDKELDGLEIGEWTRPKGGYFISFLGLPQTAKRVVILAKEAGLRLTSAGATYPYQNDPQDSNLRIAPSYPSIDDLEEAARIFALCVKIASLEVLKGACPSRDTLVS